MKTILITGATDGIGLETAKRLVSQGHRVLLHGRSEEKLAQVRRLLLDLAPTAPIETFRADLSEIAEVNQLLNHIRQAHNVLDVIINNAGVFKTPHQKAGNGLDMRFMVNSISPLIITQELMPLLSADGRVVNVSSAAQASVDLAALSENKPVSDEFQAYAQSKLALTIWSQQLAKTVTSKQVMVAVNPGSLLASKMVKQGFGLAGNDLSIGADILVRAALSDEFADANGLYFDNDNGAFALPHSDAQRRDKCSALMQALTLVIRDLSD